MAGPERDELFIQTAGLSDPLAPLAAEQAANASLTKAATNAKIVITDARKAAKEGYEQARLAERFFTKGFLLDARAASQTAIAAVSGHLDKVNFDTQAWGAIGETDDSLRQYLSEFEAYDPTKQYAFPHLEFPTTAIIDYKGQDMIVPRHSVLGKALDRLDFISFPTDVTLPLLIDPTPRSFARFEELEALDPGHARQLKDSFTMAAQTLRKKDDAYFQAPQVIRMVALLPVGEGYTTTFIPEVKIPDRKQAWNPYLMIHGEVNPSGNFLTNRFTTGKERIPVNQNGREAAFRVGMAGTALSEAQAQSPFPLGPRELDSVGIFLFPYQVREAPRHYDNYHDVSPWRYGDGYRSLGGVTRGASVGPAEVWAGPADRWSTAEKRHTTWLGDKMIPEFGGRPTVFSVRFQAVHRTPTRTK